MEQVDRIMPVGSLIPWIPKLNKNDEHSASYHQTKGWIKCDGIETCDQGLFEGQSCPSLAGRGLIGADEESIAAELQNASIPQHYHAHSHTMNSHFHDSDIGTGSNPASVSRLTVLHPNSGCQGYFDDCNKADAAAWHNHPVQERTKKVTSTMQSHSAPVTSVSGAGIGENFPAHMRVDYLFKCY